MSVRKFKRKLKTTPGSTKLYVFIMLFVMAISVPVMLSEDSAAIWAGIFMDVVAIVAMILFIRKGLAVKKKGKATIAKLEEKGLLEAAAKEYKSDDQIVCRCTNRDGKTEKLSSRKNILTPNFIYVMTENAVLTYDEVEAAHFIKYIYTVRVNKRRVTRNNDVFTLITRDGEYVDLMNVEGGRYKQKHHDALDKISFILQAKNPACKVSIDVEETVGRGGQTSHFE